MLLLSLVNDCPHVQGCPQITGEIIGMLNKNCRQLSYLNLSQCKNVASPKVQQVFEHHQLLSLNLAFIDSISDEAFLSLPFAAPCQSHHAAAAAAGAIAAMAALHPAAAAAATAGFAAKQSPLQKLNLCKSRITDRSIFRMCSLVALVEIRLQWCTGITDTGIDALVRSCPQLQLIDLKSCNSLTDSAIASIAARSCNLRELDLSWCHGYTDAGLLMMADAHCSAAAAAAAHGSTGCGLGLLDSIYIDWCPQITDAGVEALGRITTLRRIHVVGCVGVSSASFERLSRLGKCVKS